MQYRKFLADRLFNGYAFLEKGKVLVTDKDGVIEEVVDEAEAGADVEKVEGIITPGFINGHCHLELSHMKGVIPPGTGLINFLIGIIRNRGKQSEEWIREKAAEGEQEMYRNGIVGVADICNTPFPLQVKKQSKLKWHNLVEVLNFADATLSERLAHNQGVLEQHQAFPEVGTSVLTPHAPYTVTGRTFEKINELTAGQIISIHNQESPEENLLFREGAGGFIEMYATVGVHLSPFEPSGKSSLQTYLPKFNKGQTIFLVHNTFIEEEDVLFTCEYAAQHGVKVVYCLCPNANRYIEGALPPAEMLLRHNCTVILGTDSYSSNWQLNIASEVKTLAESGISLEKLLRCATADAAAVLGWSSLGSFEKGKKPGVVLLETRSDGTITGAAQRLL